MSSASSVKDVEYLHCMPSFHQLRFPCPSLMYRLWRMCRLMRLLCLYVDALEEWKTLPATRRPVHSTRQLPDRAKHHRCKLPSFVQAIVLKPICRVDTKNDSKLSRPLIRTSTRSAWMDESRVPSLPTPIDTNIVG